MAVIRNKGKRLNEYVPDYVVFDLETTGISPDRDSIIEISAVKVQKGQIAGEYSTLVNPRRHIPAGATAVNGITDKMVAGAPDIREAVDGFWNFVQDGILVGHNIHTFDTNFIYDVTLAHFGWEMKNNYVDTLYLARKCLPQLAHHKLGDVSVHFKIDTSGAHRALNDCVMNQRCYEELGKLLVSKPELVRVQLPCPKCGSELILRKGKFGEFFGCSGFPGCKYTRNKMESMV